MPSVLSSSWVRGDFREALHKPPQSGVLWAERPDFLCVFLRYREIT